MSQDNLGVLETPTNGYTMRIADFTYRIALPGISAVIGLRVTM